ncbi:MAG: hypothetical protein JSU86_06590, partial [Phycisphaerales bacterium]
MPCSRTPVGPSTPGLYGVAVLPSAHRYGVGSHDKQSFEAESHGLFTRCLRLAGWVSPPPRKTRYRLLARLCRAGFVARWVPSKGFCGFYIASSFPRLRLAQSDSSL